MTVSNAAQIEERVSASRADFLAFVWPAISSAFGDGRLITVEGSSDELAKNLDYVGIDYLFNPKHGEPFGISQRTCSGQWRTVTLSESTLDRWRQQWGRAGTLLPAVHIQSYLIPLTPSSKSLHSVAVVNIDKFMKYVKGQPGSKRTNQSEGSTFLVWDFDALELAGVTTLSLPAFGLRDPFGSASPTG
jgi:hypothetical protein